MLCQVGNLGRRAELGRLGGRREGSVSRVDGGLGWGQGEVQIGQFPFEIGSGILVGDEVGGEGG